MLLQHSYNYANYIDASLKAGNVTNIFETLTWL